MIVWGKSSAGKSNLIMQLVPELAKHGNVLIVGLEEGHERTMQSKALMHLNLEDHNGKVKFANAEMDYEQLVKTLAKKKSPKFIVIDSVQYLSINYEQYKTIKERFKKKSFIFISHSKGKDPEGATAFKIRHDAGVKVRVEGFIAFVLSRYGGNKNYVIYEEGARKYWGKQFRKHLNR